MNVVFQKKTISTIAGGMIVEAMFLLFACSLVGNELKFQGQTPRDASVASMSSPGGSGDVSLFTGQHIERFPIASIPVNGLGDIAIELSYGGNVRQAALKNNREAQASWVGLGFTLDFESIVVDHKNTVRVDDDRYFFIGASGAISEFVFKGNDALGNSLYVPSDGRPWKITRQMTIPDQIIGWTIIKDDGATYKYFQTSSLLAWDGIIGVGVAPNESLYSVRWSLSRIEVSSNSWVDFSYSTENQGLAILMPPSNVTVNPYTRAILPTRIESSTGYAIDFITEGRTDWQSYHDLTSYQFYTRRRLKELKIQYNGITTSKIGLEYDYLNPSADSTQRKLLLKRIKPLNADGLSSLPATSFEYETNGNLDSYGSIKAITYSTGGKKVIQTTSLVSDSIYTSLNSQQDHVYIDIPSHAFSRNVTITKFKESGQPNYQYELSAWNGFWDHRVLQDVVDTQQDSAIVAGENWVALYSHSQDLFLHYQWQSGVWIKDTIPMSWNPDNKVRLHAGNDFLIALDIIDPGITPFTTKVRRAFFYKRTPSGWVEYEIFDRGVGVYQEDLSGVSLWQDGYLIRIGTDIHRIFYGKYSSIANGLVSATYPTGTGAWPAINYTVGNDFVAWGEGGSRTEIREFDGTQWNEYFHNLPNVLDSIISVFSMESGLGIHYQGSTTSGFDRGYVRVLWRSGGTFGNSNKWQDFTEIEFGSDNPSINRAFSNGKNSFAVWYKVKGSNSYNIDLFEWTGTGFDTTQLLTNTSNLGVQVSITEELCTSYRRSDGSLWVSRRNGDLGWDIPTMLINGIQYHMSPGNKYAPPMFSGAKNIVVVTANSIDTHLPIRILYQWKEQVGWTSYGLNTYTANNGGDNGALPVAFGDRLYINVKSDDMSFFQIQGTDGFVGKPRISVVSKTMLYPEGNQGEFPIVVDYSYNGALLDEASNTPRLARAKQSIPYLQGRLTDGYSLSYYFNDMSASRSEFSSLANQANMSLPDFVNDLELAYLFDGKEYLRIVFDNLAQEGSSQILDTSQNFYVTHKVSGIDDFCRYFVNIDSSHARVEGVATDSKFEYDFHNGRIRSTTSYKPGGEIQIDSLRYAYERQVDAFDANLMTLIADQWTIRDSAGQRTTLGRKKTAFENHDYFQASRVHVYPDLNNMPDTLLTQFEVVRSEGATIARTLMSTQIIEYSLGVVYCAVESQSATIKVNGVSLESISNQSPFRPDGLTRSGWFQGHAGDIVEISVVNPITSGCSGNPEPYAEFSYYASETITSGEAILSIDALDQIGYDTLGNIINSKGPDGVVTATKYSPDGRFVLASVANGTTNNSVFFDAEYGFDFIGDTRTHDGWVDSLGLYGEISADRVFSGKYAMKVVEDPSTQNIRNIGLARTIVADSLVADSFMLSFWANGDDLSQQQGFQNQFGGAVYAYIQGSGAPQLISELIVDGDDMWHYYQIVVDLSVFQPGRIDSIVVTLFVEAEPNGWRAYFDDVRFLPLHALATTSVYDQVSGLLSASAGPDNFPRSFEYDAFQRPVKVFDHTGQLLSKKEFHYCLDAGGLYQPCSPNYAKTTNYTANGPIEVVSYVDGLGRPLQTRSTSILDGVPATQVAGVAYRDARGKVTRSLNAYLDLTLPNGILDYSDSVTVLSEISAYYDGDPGPQCNGFPYSEKVYENTFKGKPIKTSQPGSIYNMASGHIQEIKNFARITALNDTLIVDSLTDQDGISRANTVDIAGRYSRQVSYYDRQSGLSDSIVVTSFSDITNRDSYVFIDTGRSDPINPMPDSIPLRAEFRNHLGQVDSTWKVDYGTIYMMYDIVGNKRFMQNALRKSEDKTVYMKYDALGRKIEEGILDNATILLTKTNADNPDFPTSSDPKTVSYKWYYDYYSDAQVTLISPGSMVRVESGDQSYYKNFHGFPEKRRDSVVTKLPMSGTTKAVSHAFSFAGALDSITVYPNAVTGTGSRTFRYDKNNAGQITSIAKGGLQLNQLNQLKYADFTYDVGGIDVIRYGVRDNVGIGLHDTLQKVDYTYDTRGTLLGINSYSSVVPFLSGQVTGIIDADHFGADYGYNDGITGYFNGRVQFIKSANSWTSSRKEHRYQFEYNDLGWLTKADHNETSTSLDREYTYNALGHRMSLTAGGQITTYTYDSSPGSSRLIQFTGMAPDVLVYDMLGNLLSDNSRDIYEMQYDYRNLLTYVLTSSNLTTAPGDNTLNMTYDESGQRIKKQYNYWYNAQCDTIIVRMGGGGGSLLGITDSSGGLLGGGITQNAIGGGQNCPKATSSSTFYLYDGGVLMATFDQNDNVLEMFVNGPQGRIASYKDNDDNSLHYYLSDHLGSGRVMILAPETGTSPQVVQFYNYHPFGTESEGGGSYPTQFKWTGKEHDKHHVFDYYYFGARYYDSRLGSFTTVDKASQFASGYVYGANNPISVLDPDGNFAFAAIAFQTLEVIGTISAGLSAEFAALSFIRSIETGNADFGILIQGIKSAAGSFVGGPLGTGISLMPNLGEKHFALNRAKSFAINFATTYTINAIDRKYFAPPGSGTMTARGSDLIKNRAEEMAESSIVKLHLNRGMSNEEIVKQKEKKWIDGLDLANSKQDETFREDFKVMQSASFSYEAGMIPTGSDTRYKRDIENKIPGRNYIFTYEATTTVGYLVWRTSLTNVGGGEGGFNTFVIDRSSIRQKILSYKSTFDRYVNSSPIQAHLHYGHLLENMQSYNRFYGSNVSFSSGTFYGLNGDGNVLLHKSNFSEPWYVF